MTDQQLHEIAVAYAQVKLQHHQAKYGKSCDEKELYEYAKAYKFALNNFEKQYNEVD